MLFLNNGLNLFQRGMGVGRQCCFGCFLVEQSRFSIQGDARFSYFLSAARKDVVNANEVSYLPLYILAIGTWSLQRKNEPLEH